MPSWAKMSIMLQVSSECSTKHAVICHESRETPSPT